MPNDVLEGLQLFNNAVQGLAQQRALTDAANAVQQIQQSELNDHQKQQALQQYGQQFALRALSSGMNPTEALQTGHLIGPPRPLIQSELQAAIYGTPEERAAVQGVEQQKTARQVEVKRAEDERLINAQKNQLAAQLRIAEMNNASREEIARLKAEKTNLDTANKVGKDFRNDKLLLAQGDLQNQAGMIGQLINRPNASGLDLYTAVDAMHQLVEKTASRESDIQRALQGSQSLLQNLQTQYNIKSGKLGVIPPEVKQRLMRSIETLANKYNARAEQRRGGYTRQIEGLGGDPTLFDPLQGVSQFSAAPKPAIQDTGVQLQFVPGALSK